MKRPSAEDWPQVERLFADALDLPVDARPAFLEAASDDDRVRAEVERLLAAHQASVGFLDTLDTHRVASLIDAVEASLPTGEQVGPYRLLRELGRGGMGRVYLAEDTRLDRQVALKFLPPHLAADAYAKERLIREAKAASALDHPGIAVVYEIGESDDGEVFIAMGYYQGETLQQRIERGPLSVEQAVALARQIADALAAAHAGGIIHRDVKPGNIIVTSSATGAQDVVKLLDFGIARAESVATTRIGVPQGTVAYMSPEQTYGRSVDARADLWSLGVVLYEMLTGRRPFDVPYEQPLVYAIRNDTPTPVQALRPDVPAGVAAAVDRCLAKDPADRYPDATSLIADLDASTTAPAAPAAAPTRSRSRFPVLPLLLLAVGAGGLFFLWPNAEPIEIAPAVEAAGSPPSGLAVLPFDNRSSDPEGDYFADGLTEELIAHLSALRGLRVVAHSSVLPFRETDRSLTEIGRALTVGAVLTGHVEPAGEQVRVSVQLFDTARGEPLWSEFYLAGPADLPVMPGRIAGQVAGALRVDMKAPERQVLTRPATDNAEAYALYLKGRHFWNKRDPASYQQARTYFQQALDADPTYARAWAGLADTYDMLASTDLVAPEQAMRLARAAAERALALDDSLAEAHTALASVLMTFYREWDLAGAHLEQAVAVNPDYALAHHRYAQYLAATGRVDRALREARAAQELDPLSLYAHANIGWMLYLADRPEDAVDHLRQSVALDPDFGLAHLNLGLAYLALGAVDSAIETFETLRTLWDDAPAAMSLLGHAYARADRQLEARLLLDTLRQQQPRTPFHEAMLHVGLNEPTQAMDALEAAVDQRSGLILYLGVEPLLDPLRSAPRFQALLVQAGLAP